MKIDRSTCWTDSTCVLRYINNEHTRFKTFVSNRITSILNQTNKEQWRHVPTNLNPADLASRGMSAADMIDSGLWYSGPKYLQFEEIKWPQMPKQFAIEHGDPEVKVLTAAVVVDTNDTLDDLIERHSSWTSLKRVTTYLLRFKNNLMKAKKSNTIIKKKKTDTVMSLSIGEMKEAEMILIRRIQKTNYAEDFKLLEANKEIKRTSSLIKLDPQVNSGVLRVGGRLKMSPLNEDQKHQIILPKCSNRTTAIMRYYHKATGHAGVNHSLSVIRRRFWPVGGRALMKGIIRKCVHCRRMNAPMAHQKMADLPTERVTPGLPPFSYVRVDCFGPFKVKNGRSESKRYGIIFTCLTIRAVHLEVASSLDTNAFINALRRFIARRGEPRQIKSDNGGNFVRGEHELRLAVKNWNQQQIHDHLLQSNIEWKFNTPAASHQGGVWERCIRTVRKVLSSLMTEQTTNDETLYTLLCEVEMIINGRSITKVSDDHQDKEALTPNHLLLLRAGPKLPPGSFVEEDCYVGKRWRQIQYLANVFWRRWINEYLPALQERKKWCKGQPNVKVGDIVLVHATTPRSSWPMARVVEIFKNDLDGMVRSVKLQTSSGTLMRPITKIVHLEVADN